MRGVRDKWIDGSGFGSAPLHRPRGLCIGAPDTPRGVCKGTPLSHPKCRSRPRGRFWDASSCVPWGCRVPPTATSPMENPPSLPGISPTMDGLIPRPSQTSSLLSHPFLHSRVSLGGFLHDSLISGAPSFGSGLGWALGSCGEEPGFQKSLVLSGCEGKSSQNGRRGGSVGSAPTPLSADANADHQSGHC